YYNQDMCFVLMFAALMGMVLFRADELYGAASLKAFYPGASIAVVIAAVFCIISLLSALRMIFVKNRLMAAGVLTIASVVFKTVLLLAGWYIGQAALHIPPLLLPVGAAILLAMWLYVRWFKRRVRPLLMKIFTLLALTVTPLFLAGIGVNDASYRLIS